MYAVIRTGGKQYRVEKGEQLEVERLGVDDGSELELTPVLVVDGDTVLATPQGAVGRDREGQGRRRHTGPEDRRLHLQAEEQQPPPLRPPPGPLVIEITSITKGRSRATKSTAASLRRHRGRRRRDRRR